MNALRVLVALLLGILASVAMAGRSCEPRPPSTAQMVQALDLSVRTLATLDDTEAQVALVARVGRDLSQYGLRFSHFGIAWRDHPDGRWSIVHKLNACESAHADLYVEGLANFFSDDMFAYEAWILVPTEPVQVRLAAALSRDSGAAFHRPPYSLVAYPFSLKYQNSNAWALELVASALSDDESITDSARAQAWLKANSYQPTRFALGPLTRLGGRMFKENIAFDDHPPALRWRNRIDTVTVESVFGFVLQRDAVLHSILVKP